MTKNVKIILGVVIALIITACIGFYLYQKNINDRKADFPNVAINTFESNIGESVAIIRDLKDNTQNNFPPFKYLFSPGKKSTVYSFDDLSSNMFTIQRGLNSINVPISDVRSAKNYFSNILNELETNIYLDELESDISGIKSDLKKLIERLSKIENFMEYERAFNAIATKEEHDLNLSFLPEVEFADIQSYINETTELFSTTETDNENIDKLNENILIFLNHYLKLENYLKDNDPTPDSAIGYNDFSELKPQIQEVTLEGVINDLNELSFYDFVVDLDLLYSDAETLLNKVNEFREKVEGENYNMSVIPEENTNLYFMKDLGIRVEVNPDYLIRDLSSRGISIYEAGEGENLRTYITPDPLFEFGVLDDLAFYDKEDEIVTTDIVAITKTGEEVPLKYWDLQVSVSKSGCYTGELRRNYFFDISEVAKAHFSISSYSPTCNKSFPAPETLDQGLTDGKIAVAKSIISTLEFVR